MTDTDALRALLDAPHSELPWTQGGTKAKPHWNVLSPEAVVHGPRFPTEKEDYTTGTVVRWNADAALIAAAVTALPALLAEIDALRAVRDAARPIADRYSRGDDFQRDELSALWVALEAEGGAR
jgi:hypothetical protein